MSYTIDREYRAERTCTKPNLLEPGILKAEDDVPVDCGDGYIDIVGNSLFSTQPVRKAWTTGEAVIS